MNTTVQNTRWYRYPIFWLCSSILVASIAGCISMIILAARYPDPPLETSGGQVFKVPTANPAGPGATR